MLELKTARLLKEDKEFLNFVGKSPPDINTPNGEKYVNKTLFLDNKLV